MRSFHHGCPRGHPSATATEMFQSSITSWSSNTITLGTVDSSHRMSGSLHASRYSCVYSSKSAISSPGGGRRRAGSGCTPASPARPRPRTPGRRSGAARRATARSPTSAGGRRPRERRRRSPRRPPPADSVYGSRCGAPTRQEPNTSRAWCSPSRVWMALGGGRPPATRSPVQLHAVLDHRPLREPGQADQRVVVAAHLERRGRLAEHRNPAGAVGLDPHGRLGAADVAQERSQNQRGH